MKKEMESPYGKKLYQSTIRYSGMIADCLKLVPGNVLPEKIEYLVLFYIKSQNDYLKSYHEQPHEYMAHLQLMARWKKDITDELSKGRALINRIESELESLSKLYKPHKGDEYFGKIIKVNRKDLKGGIMELTLRQALEELEVSGYPRAEAEALLQAGIKLQLEFHSYEAEWSL